MNKVARILCIDGGGIRGIIPAIILQKIEERTGKRISELFHMIAGTSTGGILACALTAPVNSGKPRKASELVDLYREKGQKIFSSSFWHGFGSMGGLIDEKYESKNLIEILSQYMGSTKLSEVNNDVIITSYCIKKRNPYFFKSWKSRGEYLRNGETALSRDFYLKDICRATSAAPTYFEPALITNLSHNEYPLIDGGVFANNPAVCALASARKIYPQKNRFLIVSLGTGETMREIPYEKAKNWGLAGWARPLLYVLFDGVSDAVNYQLEQEFNGRDYFRFQAAINNNENDSNAPNDDMDDARPENIAKLSGLADKILSDQNKRFNNLLKQLKNPITKREDLL